MAVGPPGWSLTRSPAALLAALGISKRIREANLKAARVLATEWTKVFPATGSGRTYTHQFITVGNRVVPFRPRKGAGQSKTHKASAPGEPPAVDSGILRASIGIEQQAGDRVRVGSGVEYAKYLEFGVTDHPGGIEIKPRPHAAPALAAARDKMGGAVVSALRGS